MKDKPATLAAALLHAAHESARAAFGTKDLTDFHPQMQSAVHAGSAIEYLLKFLLVSESPLLVAEVRPPSVKSAVQSRIALSRNAYGAHLADVKSCSVEDAFLMVQEIVGVKLLRLSELQAVTKARNAAIHLAIFPAQEELEDNLCTMILAFNYAARKQPAAAFPAPEREQMIAYSARRMQVRYQAAQEKTQPVISRSSKPASASGQDNEKFIARQREFLDLQAEQLFGLDMHLWSGEFPTTRAFLCTRCGHQGVALCWAEGISFDEHTPSPVAMIEEADDEGVGLWGVAFACSWCGLTLTSNELLALESKKDPWAASLMEPHPMTVEQYTDETEPYTVKLLR
ncbi:hypothetical protein [Cryobacterium sp. M15]|uniref:hypothetical protein n=1 Tax=Cryobacterium sp. M15 TaxID=2048291 RepID=UPI000CE4EBDB|nr:hypothetical protein [Cryobacterium sp. M15]